MVGLKQAESELSSGVLQSVCWTNLYSRVKIKSSSWWLARLLHSVKAYFTIRCRLQSWNKLNAFFLFTLCCGASYLPIGLHCTYHVAFFFFFLPKVHSWKGFPGDTSGKEHIRQCSRCRFSPWIRKIPWRRAWKPTLIFLPRDSHGQRSLASYSP